MPSKYKESTTSSQDVSSSWFLTALNYTATIYDKPTKEGFKFLGNAQKIS